MPRSEPTSLWSLLDAAGRVAGGTLYGGRGSRVALRDLELGTSLDGRIEDYRGRSVLIATQGQLPAALACVELDGLARRLVLCPPDLPPEHFAHVMATAEVDAVISDRISAGAPLPGVAAVVTGGFSLTPAEPAPNRDLQTEWVLLTSGTTGLPKLVAHTLQSLTGAIRAGAAAAKPVVWGTFYDIRRYGGLQILLRTLLGGGSLVLSSAGEPTGDFLARAAAHGVTHILGTPTHWWLALTSPAAHSIAPQYVRLSGEIADQAILDRLKDTYPNARIVHAFASTEAGVAFEVGDGRAGFPASLVGQPGAAVEMDVVDGSLRIRSTRIASRYLGSEAGRLAGPDGFVDTRDLAELRGERYYFVGRSDGVINIGGQKVYPEEIETVIASHPRVRKAVVRARKNPITGAIVVADVVLNTESDGASKALEQEILQLCRAALPRHKVPAVIHIVASLAVAATGKITRRNA